MPKRILVVEPDPDNRRITETVLRREGYDVLGVEDRAEAVRRLAELRPDLVLVDLGMPRSEGWKIVGRMRDIVDVPLIALTGLALQGDEEGARTAGCDDYVTKPCRPARLREKVRQWLQPRESAPEAPPRAVS